MHEHWLTNIALAIALTLAACATAPRPKDAAFASQPQPLRSLEEGKAIALIDELLLEARLQPVAGLKVDLPQRHNFRVDLGVGQTSVGIEWVSALDRARYGDLLPPPDPEGQLRVLSGDSDSGQSALVLVLDHESYRYLPGDRLPRVDGEEERDAEQRIRRDLLDFIEYAKSQYRL